MQRRSFLTLGSLLLTTPGAFADELARTPKQTEGPFYPDKLPLDTDNDLLQVNDALTPAVGVVTYLSGRILDSRGNPVRNATVEIWQCDNNGVYIHSKDSEPKKDKQDKNFQGFGRFVTGSTGGYLFRTIKPVPYPGRAPHIHVAVKLKGKKELITQCYIAGEAQNATDGVFKGIPVAQRKLVESTFKPLKGSKIGELTAGFDIVLGITPE
ncbi:protocatechuate 3,4-dioxygenase [Armatimonas rosea]|uniref:Protocatechuate 3,4-dioxygenase beta subunit n=1 Tax=Armatimonas rosea TaxID=685828 RepID=A0A7W9W751_ARMRO|nr:protocatechuate 3,4-dioxygenase [Armatimonas rosea]MBB6050252.1 protocatechuate 3,4-dioxygenase beta subunit [Armatimonas rosea]